MMLQQLPQPNTTDEVRETPAFQKIATRMARFHLTYDYSRARSSGTARLQKHYAEGVRFSSGRVALDYENGNSDGYPTMNAMIAALERQGSAHLEWVD